MVGVVKAGAAGASGEPVARPERGSHKPSTARSPIHRSRRQKEQSGQALTRLPGDLNSHISPSTTVPRPLSRALSPRHCQHPAAD